MVERYLESNRKLWDEWTRIHERSTFYDLEGFKRADTKRAKDLAPGIVLRPYEVETVGDVQGKDLLHLQCHFGMDTLSWARLGARVTGVDFSDESIGLARRLAREIGVEAEFVCCDVYEAPKRIEGSFDIVYTSRGVLWWLPDLDRWADVIAHFLRPGGIFYITEFHPIVSVFDDEGGIAELRLRYSYFTPTEPFAAPVEGSYAEREARIETGVEYGWTHALGEIVTAVVRAGLVVELFEEHGRTDFPQLPFMAQDEEGWWRLPDRFEGELPLMFSLRARKPG